jgi:hypothetical protein
MTTAIVLAYKKWDLLLKLVARLKEINCYHIEKYTSPLFSRIILAHDGIRDQEGEAGKQDYIRVRKMCLELEREDPILSSILYTTNLGLTLNNFRILFDLGAKSSECIFFEEDKAPTLKAIQFLSHHSKIMDPLCLLDTLPLNSHLNSKNCSIPTLFTDIGNNIIGEDLLETAKKIWNVKDKYQVDFERNLSDYLSYFTTGFQFKRAFKYYSHYFSWGLTNIDRPDSLYNYCLILSKKFRICPVEPLSENWSDQNKNGLNVTTLPINRNNYCECSTKTIWGVNICPRCEKQGVSERVELNRIGALKAGLNYRISKYLASKQGQE